MTLAHSTAVWLLSALVAGGSGRESAATAPAAGNGAARELGRTEGFQHPESALYDEELDVWFVSNINGDPSAADNNGFISRLTSDGKVDSLKFISSGRAGAQLNAPKGLAIAGDTLWVADLDQIRAFNKRTGAPITSVSLAGKANFLNDVAIGPDGVYITDTGITFDREGVMKHAGPDRIFHIGPDRTVGVALETDSLQGPNGIAWDSRSKRFVIAPLLGTTILGWAPGEKLPTAIGTGPGGQDGIQVLPTGELLMTSWAASSLFGLQDRRPTLIADGLTSPADIGLDLRHGRVAVPELMEDRVVFWSLPRGVDGISEHQP